MNILMTSLFDPDRRDGISSHECSIVTELAQKTHLDQAIVLTKSAENNPILPARIAQFGGARLRIFYRQGTMSVACVKLLILSLFGIVRLDLPRETGYIFVGYHWIFWLPFLSRDDKIIFIPFDCWSAREARVAGGEGSIIRRYGRRLWGAVIRAAEVLTIDKVALYGFVSREEIDKYAAGLKVQQKSRFVERSAVLPIAAHSPGANRHILGDRAPKILVWMDGRVGYGMRSIVAAVRALERWSMDHNDQHIDITLLTRRSDSDMSSHVVTDLSWKNIEFVAGELSLFLEKFDIIILPDMNGSGLKNREIQSIAAGVAVAATNIAAEGLSNKLRASIHTVNEVDEIGQALDQIVDNPESARDMARNALDLLSLESEADGERSAFYQRVVVQLDRSGVPPMVR